MMDWFTADLHLKHENIITYCNRPFSNSKEMSNTIISKFNSCIQKTDTLYILGDISTWYNIQPEEIGKLIRKINGRKILILGNHDRFSVFDYVDIIGCESVHTHLYHEKLGVQLTHDPANSMVLPTMLWLCGHVHGLFKETRNVLNVGVDVWQFYPVGEAVIKSWVEKKRATNETE